MPMKIVNQDDHDDYTSCYQTQTRFNPGRFCAINIQPLFQYLRMPPPLHGSPINHEQPDYNRLSGSHKVICQSPKTKCNPLLSSQGHQNHCNNLFSFYGEGHQGQATYKPSCYQPLTRLNAATDIHSIYKSRTKCNCFKCDHKRHFDVL